MPTTYGYLTVSEADAYFLTRFGASEWAALNETTHKAPLLQTAYNRLYDTFDLPAAPSGTTLTIMQRAQCEMAFYMFRHLQDEDRRMGLRAQGVTAAGVISESYKDAAAVPIPPIVKQILKDYSKSAAGYMVEIGRDEDEDIDTDVT